jgi:YD repeat-containing protein
LYAYNKTGQLVKVEDWTGTTSFTLDALNHIESVLDANDRETSYVYDEVGNKKSMAYPDGSQVEYVYDLNNRLTEVADAEGLKTAYTWDAAGRLLTTAYPNGENMLNNFARTTESRQ